MEVPINAHGKKIYRLVLTGGPCGGKTTAQAVLTTVFETLGWKVYRTPEVATILLSGGVKFAELSRADVYRFQENLMKTMLQIEQTFYDLAMTQNRDVLLVCDRGFMDAVAYMEPDDWSEMKSMNNWNEVNLRDKRYDQVVHLVTAADGAVNFYQTANNTCRSEPPELAIELDHRCQRSWTGHPYVDVIDNSTTFPEKINRLVRCVATRMGIDLSDRFEACSRKRKWLVKSIGADATFPRYEDFDVQHIYLVSPTPGVEARIRRRGKGGSLNSFQHTMRRMVEGRRVETRQQLTHRDFDMFVTQRDMDHSVAEMKRRCFMYNNHYYQLDIYQKPSNCSGLTLLTTYTLRNRDVQLPEFLEIDREVTDDPAFSLYNLTRKGDAVDKKSAEEITVTETVETTVTSKRQTIVSHNGSHSNTSDHSPVASINDSQSRMIEELVESCCMKHSNVHCNGTSASSTAS